MDRRLLKTNCFSVFHYFVGLALKASMAKWMYENLMTYPGSSAHQAEH